MTNKLSCALILACFVAAAGCADDTTDNKSRDTGNVEQDPGGDASDGSLDDAGDSGDGDTNGPPTGSCADSAMPTADDSDGDGLTDAVEESGWTVRVDEDGQGTVIPRQVFGDPSNPDTDADGLCDNEESTYKTDPTRDDTDADGLSDLAEVRQWSSTPTNVDSDGDANGNPGFFDGAEIDILGTSPTLPDTDGDGRSDFEEINQNSTNALLADLPKPALNLVGSMDLGVNVKLSNDSVVEDAVTTAFESSESTTTSETSTVATGSSVENTESVTAEVTAAYPWSASVSVSGTLSQTEGYFEEETNSWTHESTRSASQAYEQLVGRTRSEGSTIDDGTIAMQLEIANEGTRPFEISDVVLTALLRDPTDPSNFTSIDTLALPDEANNIVIGEGEKRGPFRVSADIPANVALGLLSNPGGIFFQVASFKLTDREGESFTFSVGETTSNRTALVVLDFGGEQPLERYRVATNVERNADGTVAGKKLSEIMEEILRLEHGTDYVTTEDAKGKARLSAVRGVALADESTDGPLKFWAVMGTSNNTDPNIAPISERILDSSKGFDELVVMPRDKIYITYLTDADRDGVFKREEALYGTYDHPSQVLGDAPEGVTAQDSDGDGLGDFEEIRTGWQVNLPALSPYDTNPSVFPDPTAADFDNDGLNDVEEKALGTDPRVKDTDADGSPDNDDPEPVNPQITGNFAPAVNAFDVSISGATATLTANISDDNLTDVAINWGDSNSETVTSGFGAINRAHTYTSIGTFTVTMTATDSFGETATRSEMITTSVPTAGLVGEWLFSNSLDDTSGNSNTASAQSLGSVGNSCSHYTADRNGLANAAMELNRNYGGSGCGLDSVGYVSLPSLGLGSSFTISMWAWTQSFGNDVFLIGSTTYNGSSGWARLFTGEDPIDWASYSSGRETFRIPGSTAVAATASSSMPQSTWTHYAIVVSTTGASTTATMYRNGQVVATGTGAGIGSEPTGQNWYVGNVGGNSGFRYLQGQVDDIRIYNRALTAGEITVLNQE